MSDIDHRLAEMADRLSDIVAELDDLGYEQLQAAATGGDRRHLETERRLARARRAVGRAVAALRVEGAGEDSTL